MVVKPIIKWAGGKRQLISELIKHIPKNYGTYYEPFFGGGALFFYLQPNSAIINDINTQLINVYKQLQNNVLQLCHLLYEYQTHYNNLQNDKSKLDYYYFIRDTFNKYIIKKECSSESAAAFIFLNKAGFNGLYRVNKIGMFNVPSAHRSYISLFDYNNIQIVANILETANILNTDFEECCTTAKTNDFVFFDSPYYDTFDTYQSGGFTEEDHKRLYNLFVNLTKANVFCMLTNSNTDFIRNLYSNFNISIVPVKRMINCDGNNRTGTEVIITNY